MCGAQLALITVVGTRSPMLPLADLRPRVRLRAPACRTVTYVAAGQWVANAPVGMLDTLAVRVHPRTAMFVVPCESTIRRTLQACDGERLDAVLGAWLYPRLPTDEVLTVDGKTLRVARAGEGRAVHVLAAMLAGTRTVLSQRAHARFLVEDKGADYLLTVKDNQPGLFSQRKWPGWSWCSAQPPSCLSR
ncbi:MAG: hypothetical protein DLM62_01000 [Pseudonocardiales bacterium]|nr:MAG: hypothetical protein DLM62_01000 [Pseudonocardiales bacterium]